MTGREPGREGVTILVLAPRPCGSPGAQIPSQPVLATLSCPRHSPDLAPLQTAPPTALAWPGPVSAAPAGGEGQSLQQQQQLGLWVIAGFLTFLALEKMFLDSKEKEGTSQVSPQPRGRAWRVLR